jgi:nucleoside-diphosphate-sugar epimerase
MSVLVTGVNGFVGQALTRYLMMSGMKVVGAVRNNASMLCHAEGLDFIEVGEINALTNWVKALTGVDAVIHLAARVHVMQEASSDPLAEFRKVNVAGTERLAREAASAGVRRFVYVSTIKVNGEQTERVPFTETDLPNPQDPYGISKWEAERMLQRVAQETGLEVVIVRPPLVYGPQVRGNFLRLLNLVKRGMPLPFGAINNCRSLIYLGNFVDALKVCLTHPNAANKIFLVKDAEDVSTPRLIRVLAEALGKNAQLLPVPPSWMRMAGGLAGKSGEVERLLGSLVLDDSAIRRELGWKPPFSMREGLRETAEWFKNRSP